MKVTPVGHYPGPSFPTRQVIDEHPELLRLVPKRWQGNPAVIAALAGVCMLMAGARSIADGDKTKAETSRVAPVFVHGASYASYGCVSVSPPVFLTEKEAEKVIQEEAERAGIHFKTNLWILKGLSFPAGKTKSPKPAQGSTDADGHLTFNLALDGTDKDRFISYEYVSKGDALSWDGGENGLFGSYNTRTAAEEMRESLAASGVKGTYGIFYAPCRPVDAAGRDQITREELRKQVQDFIKWLKAEGVI